MKTARFSDSHATSTRGGIDWRDLAACRDRPDDFDLDVIRDNRARISAAVDSCRRCPVAHQCGDLTQRLVADRKAPKDLVQAGVIWSVEGKPAKRIRAGRPAREAAT